MLLTLTPDFVASGFYFLHLFYNNNNYIYSMYPRYIWVHYNLNCIWNTYNNYIVTSSKSNKHCASDWSRRNFKMTNDIFTWYWYFLLRNRAKTHCCLYLVQYTCISYYLYSGHILFDSEIYTTFTAYYNRESDCDLHILSYYDVFWLTIMHIYYAVRLGYTYI